MAGNAYQNEAAVGINGGGEGNPLNVAPIITDQALAYFKLIPWTIGCTSFGIFGVLSNAINMAVFLKTGFQDSITISLMALAISDFWSCFTLILATDALNPLYDLVKHPVVWDELKYIAACWPHVAFTKITTLITAFITFERCLCVSLPLKVKTIITRKRVITYLVTCYFLAGVLLVPILYSNQIGTKYSHLLNKTAVGIVFTSDRNAIEDVIYPIQFAFLSVLVFIFIIVSTGILVVKLKEKTKWRIQATGAKAESNECDASKKERRISKMVITISSLFIACFLPTAAMQSVMFVERRISIDGAYRNLNKVLAEFAFLTEAVNASLNIFIYYRNSSKFKVVFDEMFLPGVNKNKK